MSIMVFIIYFYIWLVVISSERNPSFFLYEFLPHLVLLKEITNGVITEGNKWMMMNYRAGEVK